MQPLRLATAGCLLLTALAAQQDRSYQQRLAAGQRLALAEVWETALVEFDAALELRPYALEALRWRGHAHVGAARYEQALADLDLAVEQDPEDPWTQYARAMALHHLGRFEEAVIGYSLAHGLDPQLSKPIEWRGYTLSLMGENLRALADINLALRMNPGNHWLRFIRAKIHVAMLDFDRADQDLWRVVDAQPDNAEARVQLGYLAACIGDRTTARIMLHKALELDPEGMPEARLWLFHLLRAEGEHDAARAQLDALLVDPDPDDDPDTRWVRQIADCLRQTLQRIAYPLHPDSSYVGWDPNPFPWLLAEKELLRLADAEAPDESSRRDRRCEAWLHIAAARVWTTTNRARTIESLAHVVATDARGKWEWSWARRLLTEVCYPDH